MGAPTRPFYSGRHHRTGERLDYFHRRSDAITWLINTGGSDINQTSRASSTSREGIWRTTSTTKEA